MHHNNTSCYSRIHGASDHVPEYYAATAIDLRRPTRTVRAVLVLPCLYTGTRPYQR